MTVPLVAASSASTSLNGTVAPRPGNDHGDCAAVPAEAPDGHTGIASTPPAEPCGAERWVGFARWPTHGVGWVRGRRSRRPRVNTPTPPPPARPPGRRPAGEP